MPMRDYAQDKDQVKRFLTDFYVDLPDDGGKAFKYSKQLRDIANREQVSLQIDLNDLAQFDQSLADACTENAKRFSELFYDAIQELLPEYKDKDVSAGVVVVGVVEIYIFFNVFSLFLFLKDRSQRYTRRLH